MILDARNEFADATSVAAAAGTALIGNVIDLSVARDLGNGEAPYLVITTDTEIAGRRRGLRAVSGHPGHHRHHHRHGRQDQRLPDDGSVEVEGIR